MSIDRENLEMQLLETDLEIKQEHKKLIRAQRKQVEAETEETKNNTKMKQEGV